MGGGRVDFEGLAAMPWWRDLGGEFRGFLAGEAGEGQRDQGVAEEVEGRMPFSKSFARWHVQDASPSAPCLPSPDVARGGGVINAMAATTSIFDLFAFVLSSRLRVCCWQVTMRRVRKQWSQAGAL